MNIAIHGKNIELTPSLKMFVDEKIGSLERLFGDKASNLLEARVEIGKPSRHHQKGFVYYAEVNLKMGRILFRAAEKHLDLRVAIDLVRDQIESQLRKFKQKIQEKRKKSPEGES